MDSKKQVLEELLAEAKQRKAIASEQYSKWRAELQNADSGVEVYEKALRLYLESSIQSLPFQNEKSEEIQNQNGNNGHSENEASEASEASEESEENDEILFGKSFILRSIFYDNREKRMNLNDIYNALPEYSTIDKDFISKMLPKFIKRGEITRDDDGFYLATDKLAKPERRVGARVRIA